MVPNPDLEYSTVLYRCRIADALLPVLFVAHFCGIVPEGWTEGSCPSLSVGGVLLCELGYISGQL